MIVGCGEISTREEKQQRQKNGKRGVQVRDLLSNRGLRGKGEFRESFGIANCVAFLASPREFSRREAMSTSNFLKVGMTKVNGRHLRF